MNITKRIKDENGAVISYELNIDGKLITLPVQETINLQEAIENATLLSNQEFVAKKGFKIKTVRQNTHLVPIKGKLDNRDYYGKTLIERCRKIRRYANEDRLRIDKNAHKSNSGRNINLFKLIEACDVDLHDFIRCYLSNLQPYSLKEFDMEDKDKRTKYDIWLTDVGYGIQMLLKIDDYNKNAPLVVSFHESNIGGVPIYGGQTFEKLPCAVFVSNSMETSYGYTVNFTVQRGFMLLNISTTTKFLNKDIALVDYAVIENEFINSFQHILDEVSTKYPVEETPFLSINRIKKNRLTFMALGTATANNICLLLDLYEQYKNRNSRMAIATLATTILGSATEELRKEILAALDVKYRDLDNKLYLALKG